MDWSVPRIGVRKTKSAHKHIETERICHEFEFVCKLRKLQDGLVRKITVRVVTWDWLHHKTVPEMRQVTVFHERPDKFNTSKVSIVKHLDISKLPLSFTDLLFTERRFATVSSTGDATAKLVSDETIPRDTLCFRSNEKCVQFVLSTIR